MPESGVYMVNFESSVGNVAPANLTGDDKTDWLVKVRSNGVGDIYRLEARGYDNTPLWTFSSDLGAPTRDMNQSHFPAVPWDLDHDGGTDEIVTVRMRADQLRLAILDGRDGSVLDDETLLPAGEGVAAGDPGKPSSRIYVCLAFLDGPRKPASVIYTQGTYTEGAVWAYDWDKSARRLRHRWTYQHSGSRGGSSHEIRSYDLDGDGREEILMGCTAIRPSGAVMWSLSHTPYETGHVDSVNPLKLANGETAVFFTVEFRAWNTPGAMLVGWDGRILLERSIGCDAGNGWACNMSDDYLGDEIRTHGSISDKNRSSAIAEACLDTVLTNDGKDLGRDIMPYGQRPPEWTGDSLYDKWSITPVGDPRHSSCYPADVGGGDEHGAEEILALSGDGKTLTVYFNREAKPFPSRWKNVMYRKDVVRANSGYAHFRSVPIAYDLSSNGGYHPTPQINVEGRRNIGLRREEMAGNRFEIAGAKVVALRGEKLLFRGSNSWDSDGREIDSYRWDFGDGSAASTQDASHVYPKNGVFEASLTIRAGGRESVEKMIIEVNDLITNLVVARPYSLSLRNLDAGARPYIDSDIAVTSVPASLKGFGFLRASHQDRTKSDYNSSSQRERFLRFTPARDMNVYVAFDETIEQYGALTTERPLWIGSWIKTGDRITTSFGEDRSMNIYRKFCKAGEEVILGGNYGMRRIWVEGKKSMYFLIFEGEELSQAN